MSQLGKDSQWSGRSRHDELQPYPLLGKQRLGQRYAKSTQSNLYSGADEFDLVDATGILHAHFDGERETGKGAEVSSTLLSEGRHGSLGLSHAVERIKESSSGACMCEDGVR